MSGEIDTREFSINDYDAAVQIWERVEGLEIAEGDDRDSVAQFLARNLGLSRVIRVDANFGVDVTGRRSQARSRWELIFEPDTCASPAAWEIRQALRLPQVLVARRAEALRPREDLRWELRGCQVR